MSRLEKIKLIDTLQTIFMSTVLYMWTASSRELNLICGLKKALGWKKTILSNMCAKTDNIYVLARD